MRPPRVVIQCIRTMWTKASRGGDGARLRSAWPNQDSCLQKECYTNISVTSYVFS